MSLQQRDKTTKVMGIYRIVNVDNGKTYVGCTNNLSRRRNQHRYKLRRGIHGNPRLQKDFTDFGEESFAFLVLERVKDKTLLLTLEQTWIDKLQPEYNAELKAGYSISHVKDEYVKEKISKSVKQLWADGCYDHLKGVKRNWKAGHPPNLGKKFSKETCAKISKAMTGKGNPNYGKPRSAETKRKMAAKRAKTYAGAISPDGTVYAPIHNLRAFCKEHDLCESTMNALMHKRKDQHKGWTRV